jgi:hypothetical protein
MNFLLGWILNYPRTALFAVLTVVSTTAAAYMRDQTREAVLWAFRPITRRLPWNKTAPLPRARTSPPLASEFSLVDLYLTNPNGKVARYRKTTCYIVNSTVSSYREGVTATGRAKRFKTCRGTIVRTVVEHGFYYSEINFGKAFCKGDRFVNVYEAQLYDSFEAANENWTQQISFETAHLILQIHFPAARPPLDHRTSIIRGTAEMASAVQQAETVELQGFKSLVWDIPNPDSQNIYKLSWNW